MIYITGDTHGFFFHIDEFCQENKTTTDDILIILGDAAINYNGVDKDRAQKERLAQLPITFFCIHGNHENRPENIKSYKTKIWQQGEVFVEEKYPNLIFAKDGALFNLNGQNIITIGGAYSIDKQKILAVNKSYYKWWPDEQPTDETKRYVESQLNKMNWQIDIVLSHTTPLKYEPTEVFLPEYKQEDVDKSTEQWLGRIEAKLDYQKWYCGHYHLNKKIDKLEFLHNDIIEF